SGTRRRGPPPCPEAGRTLVRPYQRWCPGTTAPAADWDRLTGSGPQVSPEPASTRTGASSDVPPDGGSLPPIENQTWPSSQGRLEKLSRTRPGVRSNVTSERFTNG